MNKKFLISWLVVFVAWMGGSFVVHGMLLSGDYSQLPNLFRSEEQSGPLFPFMLLAHVIMAGAFVWIYARGVGSGPWVGQGLRFGLAVVFLAVVPTYTIYYVVQPTPGVLAVKQIVFDAALVLVLGVIAAALNRPLSAAK